MPSPCRVNKLKFQGDTLLETALICATGHLVCVCSGGVRILLVNHILLENSMMLYDFTTTSRNIRNFLSVQWDSHGFSNVGVHLTMIYNNRLILQT